MRVLAPGIFVYVCCQCSEAYAMATVVVVFLALCFLRAARSSYVPVYGDESTVFYNVTGDFSRFPDQAVVAEEDYDYFISDLNFNVISGKLLVGAADKLYLLNTDLSLSSSQDLEASPANTGSCMASSITDDTNFDCRNHIRVYGQLPGTDTLLVCGSNAGQGASCLGVTLTGEELGIAGNSVSASDGLVSYYPEFSGFGEFRNDSTSDTVYFSAGFFQGTNGIGRHFSISYQNITLAMPSDPDSLQTTELFRTISANNNWLRFPVTFVGSYRADYAVTAPATTASDYQFWFVFLRENLVSSDVIYSRLVRICRNDPGSTLTSAEDANYFTTYMKARIFCERDKPSGLEFTGTLDYQYNSITSFAFTDSSRYYGGVTNNQKLLYGAFSSSTSGPVGSALCVYPAGNSIESAGTGRTSSAFDIFREDISDTGVGSPVENTFVQCDPDGRLGDDQQLVFISPEKSVEQIGDNPLLVLDDVIITQMVQDSVCVVTRADNSSCVNQDVLFLGLDSGHVLKVVFGTDEVGASFPIIAEDIQLDDLNTVNRLTIEEDGLFVSSWSKIYRMPLHRCGRFDTCSGCVAARDPHCVWSNTDLQCVQNPLSGTVDPQQYFQNIHTGESTGCDYPQIGFAESSVLVSEGEAFVSLTVMASGAGFVELYLEDGTATSGDDYVNTTQVIEFTSASTQTVSVSLIGNSVVEGDKWLVGRLRGTAMGGVILTQDSVNITIEEDDSVVISFSAMSYSSNEGGSFVIVTIDKEGDTNFDTSIRLQTIDDTAIAGDDYLQQDLELTFEPTTASLNVVIPLVNDDVMEAGERFSLSLQLAVAAQNAVIGSLSSASVNITDDDVVFVSLSLQFATYNESDDSIDVQILKTGQTALPVTVLLSTVAGSAAAPNDFTAKTDEEITFSPSQTSRTSTVSLENDDIAEDEESFQLTLTRPADSPQGLEIAEGVVTVYLRDTDTVVIQLSTTTYTWSEGVGEVVIVMEKIGTAERDVTATLQAVSLTAEAVLDFVAEFGEVQFSPSDTQQQVTMTIVDDDLLEDSETLGLSLTPGQGSTTNQNSSAMPVILDNDEVSVQFDVISCALTASEGDAAVELVVTRMGLSSIPVQVMVQTQDGTATASEDYTMVAEIFNISSTAFSRTVTVPLVPDAVVEGVETFSVSLSVEDGQQGVVLGSSDTAIITITDDDSVSVSLTANSFSVAEEEGLVNVSLQLSGAHSISVSASLTTLSGSAIADEDFTLTTETVTFDPGVSFASVLVPILDDAIREEVEMFEVSVSGLGGVVSAGSVSSASVHIIDSDTVSFQWSSQSYTVDEGMNSVILTLIRLGATSFDVNVSISANDITTQGSEDTSLSTSTLTFTPDLTALPVELVIVEDDIVEQTESLTLTVGTVDQGVGDQSTEVVIRDDDTVEVSLSDSSFSVSEGVGTAVLTLTLTGSSSVNLTVTLDTMDGTATAPSDYTATSVNVVLVPGSTQTTVNVPVEDDTVQEDTESFLVRLSVPEASQVVLGNDIATVTITDDDSVEVSLSSGSYVVSEGVGVVTVILEVIGSSSGDVLVRLQTTDGTAIAPSDYSAVSQDVLLVAGTTQAAVDIAVLNDRVREAEETLSMSLSVPDSQTGAVTLGPTSTANVTIIDDDNVVVLLTVSELVVMETAAAVSVVVELQGQSSSNVSVTLTTVNGTATAGEDYQPQSLELIFLPFQSAIQEVAVPLIDDTEREATEEFRVQIILSGGSVGVVLGQSSATVQIQDNDSVRVMWETAVYTVSEATGSVELTLLREGSTSYNLTVTVSTLNSSATSNEDYAPLTSQQVVFSESDTARSVLVDILNDNLVEVPEVFVLMVVAEPEERAVIEAPTANVYIVSDDEVLVQFVEVAYTAGEGDTLDVDILTNAAASFEISVSVSSEDSSADEGKDYYLLQNAVSIAAGATTASLPVLLTLDTLAEGTESFKLSLVLPSDADPSVQLGQRREITVTIINVDIGGTTDPTTATTDKTDTPSVGRLGTEDDCVYDSQDAALGVTILLAVLAFVLLTTNVLTALCLYRCYRRRVPKSYAHDTCELSTTVQRGGGIGAASNIYEQVNTPPENLATTFTNPAAAVSADSLPSSPADQPDREDQAPSSAVGFEMKESPKAKPHVEEATKL